MRCLHLLYLAIFLSSISVLEAQEETARGGRIRPPDAVKCDRNHLTSFTGKVTSFKRTAGSTVMSMNTDENTKEKFTLRHPDTDNAKEWFLLNAKPFVEENWKKIESSKNHLLPEMRATVWVCDDGSNAIVDWQPPEPDQEERKYK